MHNDPIHSKLLLSDPHDAQTAANAHPPDWQNPVPKKQYDLVVIGGGTAGLVSAGAGALLGAKVAMIERSYTGGDCLISGCVPSKALLCCARAAAQVQRSSRFGISAKDVQVDFAKVMEHVRSARSQISQADAARAFSQRYGVDIFFGNAAFTGPATIDVNGTALRFRRAIIATGSNPVIPDIPGLANVGYFTNETIFNLTVASKNLAIIGGGPLGCELAQAFAMLGSTVTLIEHNMQFLHREDSDAAGVLLTALKNKGLDVRLGTAVQVAARDGDTTTLQLACGKNLQTLRVDAVLLGAGRVANAAHLRLDMAGVKNDSHGVIVDDFLRTSNRRIFAAGDVCLKQKFTHTADASARTAAQNALLMRSKRWSKQVVPHVIYTEPELAQVGPVMAENGHGKIYTIPFAEVDRAVTVP